jgi:alpha/beta superfamily hydrolase
MNSEKIFIKYDDIQLEADLFQKGSDSDFIILITHPHPQMGGNMHNNVVSSIFEYLIDKNVPAIRFNFRGVGRSTGMSTGGNKEREDVKAVIDFLEDEKQFKNILICGYSFGAAIGCSIVNYSSAIIGFIAISFPWDYMGEKYKEMSQTIKPKFFLQGNQDNIASFNNFYDHLENYEDPKEYTIIEGADHFYWGFEKEIAKNIFKIYKSLLE